MTGHETKRDNFWRVVLEHGEQRGLRCPACTKVQHVRRKDGTEFTRERGTIYWPDADPPDTCPRCDGLLTEVTARRLEMLPGKYTRRSDAQRARHDEIRDRERGEWVPPSALTLGQYLSDCWEAVLDDEIANGKLTAGSARLYRVHLKQRIIPVLGDVELQQLSRADIARFRRHMATTKGVRGGIPSAQTRRQTLVVLHKALEGARAEGLVRTNAAQGVELPRVAKREMATWSKADLRMFLTLTGHDRLYPLWRFLSQTGLRRGEALGLKAEDLDLDHGKVRLVRQHKQDGYRAVDAPLKAGQPRSISIDTQTVATLREQLDQKQRDAQDWGAAYTGTDYVFTNKDGLPLHPDRVSKLFDAAVKKAGLPRIRLHDLRHTWATLALRAGVHPKVVQERFGHTEIGVTMDTYSHVMPDMQEAAAEMVAALIDGPDD